jgi:hypothetical protein
MMTMAASGLSLNTFATDAGISVCSASSVPPARLSDSPTMSCITVSASFTD